MNRLWLTITRFWANWETISNDIMYTCLWEAFFFFYNYYYHECWFRTSNNGWQKGKFRQICTQKTKSIFCLWSLQKQYMYMAEFYVFLVYLNLCCCFFKYNIGWRWILHYDMFSVSETFYLKKFGFKFEFLSQNIWF